MLQYSKDGLLQGRPEISDLKVWVQPIPTVYLVPQWILMIEKQLPEHSGRA